MGIIHQTEESKQNQGLASYSAWSSSHSQQMFFFNNPLSAEDDQPTNHIYPWPPPLARSPPCTGASCTAGMLHNRKEKSRAEQGVPSTFAAVVLSRYNWCSGWQSRSHSFPFCMLQRSTVYPHNFLHDIMSLKENKTYWKQLSPSHPLSSIVQLP